MIVELPDTTTRSPPLRGAAKPRSKLVDAVSWTDVSDSVSRSVR